VLPAGSAKGLRKIKNHATKRRKKDKLMTVSILEPPLFPFSNMQWDRGEFLFKAFQEKHKQPSHNKGQSAHLAHLI
jgi:hypothetical protein